MPCPGEQRISRDQSYLSQALKIPSCCRCGEVCLPLAAAAVAMALLAAEALLTPQGERVPERWISDCLGLVPHLLTPSYTTGPDSQEAKLSKAAWGPAALPMTCHFIFYSAEFLDDPKLLLKVSWPWEERM